MIHLKSYFGTQETLPKLLSLKAGNLNCFYEQGNIRYISLGNQEILRMIYSAVRDENWFTVPYEIIDEKITNSGSHFSISYTAIYKYKHIQYEAEIKIIGDASSSISFSFKGKSKSAFKRNRIGLCVLHPINESQGKKCKIISPDNKSTEDVFPLKISPYQLFKDIHKMKWDLNGENEAELIFKGEIFETEDQRNWSDDSFKTYCTPLDIPFPVNVKAGETSTQRILLKLLNPQTPNENSETTILLEIKDVKYPFPKIGFSRSSDIDKLSDSQILMMKKVLFNHYRVEVKFEQDWKSNLNNAFEEAHLLNVQLELVLFFEEPIENRLDEFLEAIKLYKFQIYSILILNKNQKATTPDLLKRTLDRLRKALPAVKLGAGTDAFFAELNRNRQEEKALDFISYSINPQVHASDIRSLIENLVAQRYTVESALSFAVSKPVHISPVTLKMRYNPDATSASVQEGALPENADIRQPALFTAAWTTISLKNLAKASSITYFETIGLRGIAASPEPKNDFPAAANQVYPVYLLFLELLEFGPTKIIETYSNKSLSVDALLVENEEGVMAIICNFSESDQIIEFKFPTKEKICLKTLNQHNIYDFLNEPQAFLDSYEERDTLSSQFIIDREAILFIKFKS